MAGSVDLSEKTEISECQEAQGLFQLLLLPSLLRKALDGPSGAEGPFLKGLYPGVGGGIG